LANLSAYLNCSISLDYIRGKVVLKDTSLYPDGVAAGITGIVSVKQPDMIAVEGDWDAPNITFNGSVLTDGEVELRTQADGTPQQGLYTVTYEVDHPDYSPTKIVKTFQLSYVRSEVTIQEYFDVFTPNLSLQDTTNYNAGAFNAPTISRVWNVSVGTVGTVSGTAQTLDLALNSNYYDAKYTIGLTTELVMVHSTYSYLTVRDRVFQDTVLTANTPPTFTTLQTYLKEIKAKFDGLESDVKTVSARQSYEYAESILAHIKSRICKGDTMNLYPQIQDFLNVYYDYTSSLYVNTNLPIATYGYADVDCGVGGGVLIDARISTEHINNWNAAFGAIPPDDLEFVVGVTEGAPVADTDTFTSNALVNRRVRLFIGKIPQATISVNGDPYYEKPKASDTLTVYGYKWMTGDYIKIEFY
jgi:hypothetical protein